jgi:hypothetical protein
MRALTSTLLHDRSKMSASRGIPHSDRQRRPTPPLSSTPATQPSPSAILHAQRLPREKFVLNNCPSKKTCKKMPAQKKCPRKKNAREKKMLAQKKMVVSASAEHHQLLMPSRERLVPRGMKLGGSQPTRPQPFGSRPRHFTSCSSAGSPHRSHG